MRNRESSQLILAYDATLEAVSTALEWRDKEAKEHTQRVTEMALSLAKALGVNNKELVHIRRGALLHDIGNLKVQESILHKQGELTAEEWVTIHMHPFYAHEIIGSIDLLKSTLDIAYCHHEKWDGSGYPRGLKGEQIPLAARLFAIVDVYDALTSDRPFRKAWSKAKALNYVREQSGQHFDPQVVAAFLKLQI